jgi:hypothetical protein
MLAKSLSLPVESEAELVAILQEVGCDISPIGETAKTDKVSWQIFLCHRRGALATASIAVMLDGTEQPFVTVSTMRKALWRWTWPTDKRLVKKIVEMLVRHGGAEFRGKRD